MRGEAICQALGCPAVVATPGLLAFRPAPIGPRQTQRRRARRQGQRGLQQVAHCRNGQLCQEGLCPLFFSWALARIIASQAWAIMDKVMWRYQLCQ